MQGFASSKLMTWAHLEYPADCPWAHLEYPLLRALVAKLRGMSRELRGPLEDEYI